MAEFNFKGVSFKTETENKLKSEEIIQLSNGEISEYRLKLVFEENSSPSEYKITWLHNQVDTVGFWSPIKNFDHHITADWMKREAKSKLSSGMPLASLYGISNSNSLTISLSDAKTPLKILAGVVEENAKVECVVVLFCEKISPIKEYEAIIRLDTRKINFCRCVEDTKYWWEKSFYAPSYTPKYASDPLYSTWYSFHQRTIPEEIVAQCRQAKEYGMDTVIVDDGWQTDDNSRGYGYCGDWEVCKAKIPNMKDFVDKIHDLDMRFMVWFSVPFVGVHSKSFARFKGKYLNTRWSGDAKVLDPRFSDVREFITSKYVSFVKEYGIDGLKLDFIDAFVMGEEASTDYDNMDTISVEDGVEMLLSEISAKLKEINPEFLIEFRQSYVGPVISQYGNMFRVGDCPNDPYSNRMQSLNMRMSQTGMIHSDMMMWNKDETNEALSYQLLGTMFCVPQISILFEGISSDHKKILKNYLSFWCAHKDTILNGKMEYLDVHANYSMAKSTKNGECVSVMYQGVVNKLDSKIDSYVFNSTANTYIYLEADKQQECQIYNSFGDLIKQDTLNVGVTKIEIPVGGMVKAKGTDI